jgi:nitroreductase
MKNNISELIKTRRATPPKFLAKTEVSNEVIEELLENANWAPTHKNTEPWRFKIFRGEAKQKLAANIYELLISHSANASLNLQKAEKFTSGFKHVPVAIAIILERDVALRIPEWEELAAVAMAVQNMWLTATANGFGAFWSTPEFLPILSGLLNMKEGQKLLGFFYLGEIAMDYPSSGRGNVHEKTEWFD